MRKSRATIAALSTVALVGVAGPAAAATADRYKPNPSRVSISSTLSVNKLLSGDVEVFTFKISARHEMGLEEVTYDTSAVGGTVVFFSCSAADGSDQSGYADGHDCETLDASSKHPATYIVGIRPPWTAPAGTRVAVTLRVSPDGVHDVYQTASTTVYARP